LDSDDVTVEIIPDLIHVHGAVIQMVVKCKTPDRVVLVTDSILAAGLGEGKLEFAESMITVKDVRPFLKTVCWPEVPLRWQTVSEIW